MVWRGEKARVPALGARATVVGQKPANKTVLMSVTATVLLVAIAAMVLRPGQTAQVAAIPEPVRVAPAPAAPVPETEVAVGTIVEAEPVARPLPSLVVEPVVSRADASLLELRQAVASEEASHILRRQALSGSDIAKNLPLLARNVLGSFGYRAPEGDRLHALLVGALADEKSDAFIDALLNAAIARGEFEPPQALTQATGRFDTPKLLRSMIRTAQP